MSTRSSRGSWGARPTTDFQAPHPEHRLESAWPSRYGRVMLRSAVSVAVLLSIAACSNVTPASKTPAASAASGASIAPASATIESSSPPDGEIPKLRPGAMEPVDDPKVLDLRLVGRH